MVAVWRNSTILLIVSASLLHQDADAFSLTHHSLSSSSCRPGTVNINQQWISYYASHGSAVQRRSQLLQSSSDSNNSKGNKDEDGNANIARQLQEKAQKLRDEIRQMETSMGRSIKPPDMKSNNNNNNNRINTDNHPHDEGISLKDKRILILGANGRLGSMITRHLLRTHPEVKEVVAAVHYVPREGSSTTRGYGRLSYEVGAEDGIGKIGPIWSSNDDEYNASFQYNPDTMSGYNLNKLRVVEVELLDPNQVRTISENVDAMIYCATDFEGNRPRAVASLNAAFLFRAVASPAKGRVEVEGVRNCLEGLVGDVTERRWREQRQTLLGDNGAEKESRNKSSSSSNPIQFILVSTSPDAYGEFETPFGEFNGLKRQGERIVMEEFPSVSYCVLQMGKFDDNFVQEGLELLYEETDEEDTLVVEGVVTAKKPRGNGMQKRINRRDAARAAVEALLDEKLEGKKVQVYTATRKSDIW